MKQIVSVLIFIVAIIFSGGLSCSPRATNPAASPLASALTRPEDWQPLVFPAAVVDQKIQTSMTAVAATPDALDQDACICFGFPVHDAVFYAYHTDASTDEVMDFYAEQMAGQGWKRIATDTADTTLPHLIWQQGATGPLVAYLMAAPMKEGGTLIYLSVAVSDMPQKIIEE